MRIVIIGAGVLGASTAFATMIETRVGFRPVGAGVRPLLGWVHGVAGLAVGNGLGAAGHSPVSR